MHLPPTSAPRRVSTQDRPFALPLSENEIQRAVFDHLRERGAPGIFAFHPKNGGVHQRGRRSGINSGLGVVSGVPDVILIHHGAVYALELKTDAKTAKLSDEQLATMKRMAHAGTTVDVAFGLDAALRWLEDRGLLTGRAA